jgi:hypothetical protein
MLIAEPRTKSVIIGVKQLLAFFGRGVNIQVDYPVRSEYIPPLSFV